MRLTEENLLYAILGPKYNRSWVVFQPQQKG